MSTDTPILFVHGIRTSATMWRAQLAELHAAGHRALAIDLPGHGSRIGEHFSVDAAVASIDAGVKELGGRVLLVGLSLGGYFAIEYAARYPQNVAGLVAASCSTVPGGIGLAGYRALAAAIKRLPDRGLGLNNVMARLAVGKDAAADLSAGGIALSVMDEALTATGTLKPLDALTRYPGPIWLVNGRLDHFRLDEKRFANANPAAKLIVIPGATHLLSLVAPEKFADVIGQACAEIAVDNAPIVDSAP